MRRATGGQAGSDTQDVHQGTEGAGRARHVRGGRAAGRRGAAAPCGRSARCGASADVVLVSAQRPIRAARPRAEPGLAAGATARDAADRRDGRAQRGRRRGRQARAATRSPRRRSRPARRPAPSCAATLRDGGRERQRVEVDLERARRWRARCAPASVAMPSERSISACAPARGQRARPRARRGSRAQVARRPASSGPSARPSQDRQARAGGAERAGHHDRVAGPRAVAADQLRLVVGPADDGHRDRQRGRARHVAAGDRRARPRGELLHPARRARARRPRRSPRGARARRRPRPRRRPSRRGRSARRPARGGRRRPA